MTRIRNHKGFTLLEVIVSLAITGFILGSLFTLVAGSKQLSWRAGDNLERARQIRAAANFALLQNEFNTVEEILEHDMFAVEAGEILEKPERKTQATPNGLQQYEILNTETDETYRGVRWVEFQVDIL
ncbi:MAG: type II secretion system protein [Gammaproteobacteria bacterium]